MSRLISALHSKRCNPKKIKAVSALMLLSVLLPLLSSACIFGDKTADSLVKVHADNVTLTGVILDKGGYVVAPGHFVKGVQSIGVELKSGNTYEGKLLCYNAARDIAVIKINGDFPALQPAPTGDSDLVHLGDEVSVSAYPPGSNGTKAIKGNVSKLPKFDDITYIQSNAALDPGMAGGALFNKAGEIIGVVGWNADRPGHDGFTLPVNGIMPLLGQAQAVEATPLAIESMGTPAVFNDHAVISWKTTRPATGQVEYGLTAGSYGFTTNVDTSLLVEHNAVIQNLQPKTTYHFRVWSVDGCANQVVSGDLSFTTALTGAVAGKLAISDSNVYDVTSSAATISWITNKPARSVLTLSTNKATETENITDKNLTYDHKMRIDGLQPEAHYSVSIFVQTEYGESVQGSAASFITPPTSPVCCKLNCRLPDFHFKNLQGGDFSNSNLQGKKVALLFTKTGCSICMKQALLLDEFYRKFSDPDVLIIMVSSGERQQDVEEWMQKYGIIVPVYLDDAYGLLATCQLRTVPSLLFLDTGSVIRDIKSGGFANSQDLTEAFKQFMLK